MARIDDPWETQTVDNDSDDLWNEVLALETQLKHLNNTVIMRRFAYQWILSNTTILSYIVMKRAYVRMRQKELFKSHWDGHMLLWVVYAAACSQIMPGTLQELLNNIGYCPRYACQ